MCRYCDVAGENGCKTLFVQRMEGNFRFTVKPSDRAGRCADRRFAWPWRRLLFHCSCVVLAMRSVQNRDAWIQEPMFQLRIV